MSRPLLKLYQDKSRDKSSRRQLVYEWLSPHSALPTIYFKELVRIPGRTYSIELLPHPTAHSHSLPPSRLHRTRQIMSGSVPPTQLTQDQASSLGPGIADLFIQGIESGLVLAQFSQWFNDCDRIESSLLSTVVVFVTLVGLCASRHFTAWLRTHYPFPFMKCAVRIELCIGLV